MTETARLHTTTKASSARDQVITLVDGSKWHPDGTLEYPDGVVRAPERHDYTPEQIMTQAQLMKSLEDGSNQQRANVSQQIDEVKEELGKEAHKFSELMDAMGKEFKEQRESEKELQTREKIEMEHRQRVLIEKETIIHELAGSKEQCESVEYLREELERRWRELRESNLDELLTDMLKTKEEIMEGLYERLRDEAAALARALAEAKALADEKAQKERELLLQRTEVERNIYILEEERNAADELKRQNEDAQNAWREREAEILARILELEGHACNPACHCMPLKKKKGKKGKKGKKASKKKYKRKLH